jgi:hypothetical protein
MERVSFLLLCFELWDSGFLGIHVLVLAGWHLSNASEVVHDL